MRSSEKVKEKPKSQKGKDNKPKPPPKVPKPRMGDMYGNGTGDDTVHSFYSAGTRATQPLFSDLKRNFYATIDLNGTPFFTGTQPTAGQSKYDYNRIALDVADYFVDNLFGAFEYYRVTKIETTFIWGAESTRGAVNGELFTSVDKDSRDAETSNAYINRRNLKRKVFDINTLSHTVTYQPYLVDYVGDDEDDAVKYIQPQDRWWNCADFRLHRWGCLRYILINNNQNAYATDANVFVRHRLWIETKGQKDVITPSVPPALGYLGKQLLNYPDKFEAEVEEEIPEDLSGRDGLGKQNWKFAAKPRETSCL